MRGRERVESLRGEIRIELPPRAPGDRVFCDRGRDESGQVVATRLGSLENNTGSLREEGFVNYGERRTELIATVDFK